MVPQSHDAYEALDPTVTNPEYYRVLFENERVRVLEYRDSPGDRTTPHRHPDSVMVTLTAFRRRVSSGDRAVEVEIPAGQARWLDAQSHTGENIGTTDTHTIFVELKDVEVKNAALNEAALNEAALNEPGRTAGGALGPK